MSLKLSRVLRYYVCLFEEEFCDIKINLNPKTLCASCILCASARKKKLSQSENSYLLAEFISRRDAEEKYLLE